jgi:hypothetical protein
LLCRGCWRRNRRQIERKIVVENGRSGDLTLEGFHLFA